MKSNRISFLAGLLIFSFSLAAQSTYYWVGNSGNWSDAAHWSLSSGGAGGAGIPDQNTSVIFDANSFQAPGSLVNLDLPSAHCNNMIWVDGLTPINPILFGDSLNQLIVHGSLILSKSVKIAYRGAFRMAANDSNNVINTEGQTLQNDFYFIGLGKWSLDTSLNLQGDVQLRSGFLDLNGKGMICWRFLSDYTSSRTFDISGSIIQVSQEYNSWYVNTQNFNLIATGSLVILHGPHPELINIGPDTLRFSGILFTDTSGVARLHFSESFVVLFSGDAVIEEYNKTDTLYFTPGKSYEFTTAYTQYITGGWYSIGAGCYPIKIRSSLPGVQATVNMQNARMQFEHNVIRDLAVSGSGNFNAGVFSADSGNNSGLTFGKANLVYANVLGNDTTLCPGDSKFLSSRYYWYTAERLWQDGSTEKSYRVTQPGTYILKLTYFPGCSLYDTIVVNYSDVMADLGPADTVLCEGDQLMLKTPLKSSWTARWRDQSVRDSFPVSTGGLYSVTVTDSLGCTAQDFISIQTIAPPQANLGSDTAICEGETVLLLPNPDLSLSFLWQDNSTQASYEVSKTGSYSVTVSDQNGCAASDEINVTVYPRPKVILGDTLHVCDNSEVLLDVNVSNAKYLWNTGAKSKSVMVNNGGIYSVTVTDANGCTDADSIEVILKASPQFSIGDTSVCFEEISVLTLEGPEGNYTYKWSTGDSVRQIKTSLPGTMWLRVTSENGCSATDIFTVENSCRTQIHFPNAFSPNGDGINDIYRVGAVNIERASYRIYDRWGQLIFATSDKYCNWDGTIGGSYAPAGMYFITASGVDYFRLPFDQSERILLLR